MTEKYDLLNHLVGLQSLIQFQTTQTGSTPSGIMAREYQRTYDKLRDIIAKEEEDEAGKREQHVGVQGASSGEQGIGSGGESDGSGRGGEAEAIVRRT